MSDINSLESTLSIESIFKSISSLSESDRKWQMSVNVRRHFLALIKLLSNKLVVITNQVELLENLQNLLVLIKMMQFLWFK